MRIVKEAEERRNEILDAADELFGRKGFDGTSTNDILKRWVSQEVHCIIILNPRRISWTP